MEGKLELERTVGNLQGIPTVKGVKSIIHKQFADYTLLVRGASIVIGEVGNTLACLEWFRWEPVMCKFIQVSFHNFNGK